MNNIETSESKPLEIDFNDVTFLKKAQFLIRAGKLARVEELRVLLEDHKDHPYYKILMPLILNRQQ